MKRVQFVGLDVHADTIAVVVAEPDGTVRSVGVIPNRPESIRQTGEAPGIPRTAAAAPEVPGSWTCSPRETEQHERYTDDPASHQTSRPAPDQQGPVHWRRTGCGRLGEPCRSAT